MPSFAGKLPFFSEMTLSDKSRFASHRTAQPNSNGWAVLFVVSDSILALSKDLSATLRGHPDNSLRASCVSRAP
jgi:hypothetical protein